MHLVKNDIGGRKGVPLLTRTVFQSKYPADVTPQ